MFGVPVGEYMPNPASHRKRMATVRLARDHKGLHRRLAKVHSTLWRCRLAYTIFNFFYYDFDNGLRWTWRH